MSEDKPFESEDGKWKGIYRHRKNETPEDKKARELANELAKQEKIMEKTADSVSYKNIENEFEDEEGNWIGIGLREKKTGGQPIPSYYSPTNDEMAMLRKECEEGNEESCNKLKKLEEQDEEHLKRLMAIAQWDEEPPKLKEPKE